MSATGRTGGWMVKKDNASRDLAAGVWLACSMLFPPLFLAPVAVLGVTAIADGVSASVAAKRAAERKRREEVERLRLQREQAERTSKLIEQHRAEAEDKRRRSTPEYRLAEAKRAYDQALKQIEFDASLDATEKTEARAEAKARYLRRLDEVM